MANTTSLQEVLFKISDDVSANRVAFVKTVTSQTVFICPGISLGQGVSLKYAIARVLGRGIRQVTAYNDSSQTITVASNFDSNVVAGDMIEIAWWEADKASQAIASANDAVRQAYPYYYRETKTRDPLTGTVAISGGTTVTGTSTRFMDELLVGDVIKIGTETGTITAIASQTSLTVSAAFVATTSGVTCYHASGLTYTTRVHTYLLPTSVHELLAVGWAMSANDPVMWIPPLSTWRVIGTDGSFTLHLESNTRWAVDYGNVSTGYANPIVGAGSLADAYNGYEMFLYYASREPEYTSMTDVTNLPLHYFSVASAGYAIRRLAMLDTQDPESRRLGGVYRGFGGVYKILQDEANKAKNWLHTSRPQIAEIKGPQLQLR